MSDHSVYYATGAICATTLGCTTLLLGAFQHLPLLAIPAAGMFTVALFNIGVLYFRGR